jgi:hypothetical protein
MYWDEKILERVCKNIVPKVYKMTYETEIGNFYVYLSNSNNDMISGKVAFFPSSK